MGFLLLSTSGMSQAGITNQPVVPVGPSLEVAMTAYNAVPGQTDEDPFTTASGAYSNPEVVAARSQDLKEELPFGTIIEIDGPAEDQHSCGYDVVSPVIGYRVIADTMNKKFTNRIDVLLGTDTNITLANGRKMNASKVMGVCHGVTVRVVGHIDPKRMTKMPKTQTELAMLVTGSGNALARK